MSRSPNDEQSEESDSWIRSRVELSDMIRQGRSFSGHERNCLFLNTGKTRFATVSGVSGLDFPDDGRAVATADWDHDGDLDLWISNRNAPRLRFLRNNATDHHNFLALRLLGNGRTTNRDAVGARVEVHFAGEDGRPLVRTLRAGEGFLSQSSKWLHFGLGDTREVTHLVVHWPGGTTESFSGVSVNRRYVIEQSTSMVRALPASNRDVAIQPSAIELPDLDQSAPLRLYTKLPMPKVTYRQFDGSEQFLEFDGKRPLLIVLWASWCPPCLRELREITAHETTLRDAKIDVLALAVDGVGTDPSDPAKAKRAIEQLEFPFRTGIASVEFLTTLQEYHDHLVFSQTPLPIPCSFLVDTSGRLTAIYKGPVSADVVIADASSAPEEYVAHWERSACIPGRAISHDRVRRAAMLAETRTRYRVASSLFSKGDLDDAATGFRALVEVDPNCGDAHARLAAIYLVQGKLAEATRHVDRALEINPELASAHNTRGNLFVQQDQLEDARESFDRALTIHPEYADAHNNLGTIHARQGQSQLAEDHFRLAINFNARFSEAHNNLGRLLAQNGKIAQAAEQFATAVQIDPNDAEAHNNLGTMYASRKSWEKAIRNYERALEIDPNYVEARRNLQRVKRTMIADGKP